jgi:hypothetical protein
MWGENVEFIVDEYYREISKSLKFFDEGGD